ncbi:MAG TPA: nitroreductase/quinone reductase family protein [Aggregatilineales bacterium]|nr:nitroreductase/quinone reductase family protein [Aggregatilineales bacterium]
MYGRKTGSLYSTPVSLVIQGNQRFLVAPFGEVNWVRNARASGQVILSRRGQQEVVKLHELNPSEGAPILKTYLAMRPFTAPYFDNRPDAPVEAFEQEASNHPVFRISPSAE